MARGKQQGQTLRKKSLTKRIRNLGFRARMSTVGGRRVLKSRRLKGRYNLSVSEEIAPTKSVKDKKYRRRK